MNASTQAGPSVPRPKSSLGSHARSTAAAGNGNGEGDRNLGQGESEAEGDLWSDILSSARRAKSYGRKNIILLSERHHGRTYLLEQLLTAHTSRAAAQLYQARKKRFGAGGNAKVALGYEVMHVGEEGDEESVPPVSIFYPPSGDHSAKTVLPASLPSDAISNSAIVILLDWTKPSRIIPELVEWLKWIQEWAGGHDTSMRDQLQAFIQRYTEPLVSNINTTGSGARAPAVSSASTYSTSTLLPLGQGTLTLNPHGIPIIVVCSKADLMDGAGEAAGLKGNAWEERCDWIQQTLRTICLAHGAALWYTARTQPSTYTTLRSYILHRLHAAPIDLVETDENSAGGAGGSAAHSGASRFPFNHRANVLDKDAVLVPTGWDSWGKINVLREGFDPAAVLRATEGSLAGDGEGEGRGERIEDVWKEIVPELDRAKPNNSHALTTHVEAEQSFLSRHFDTLAKDPNRDPRAAFRVPSSSGTGASISGSGPASAGALSAAEGDTSGAGKYGGYGGVVGPMGTGGLGLPGVEKAMAEMEGQGAEDLKEKFAKLGKKDGARGAISPSTPAPGEKGAVPNEALHNFFQGLLATKGKTSSASKSSAKSSTPPSSAGLPSASAAPPS